MHLSTLRELKNIMKKKVYIGLILSSTITVSAFLFVNNDKQGPYQPRHSNELVESIDGAFEYLHGLRANQHTGVVSEADVANAWQQVEQFRRNYKASFPLNWVNNGPDNVGGRTRAILVDRNDTKVLYAGGVSGGLFKSTNKGASWYPVDDKFQNMNVVSICQTANGNIYFGTGESFASGAGNEFGSPGFPGMGIYKSTDGGNSFTRILQTNSFTYVNKLTSHPTKNYVLAATNMGLYASDEADDTKWTRVLPGNAQDVAMDRNGNAFAYTNRIYRSTTPNVDGSYKITAGVDNGSRMGIAVSHSDPNYVYVIVVGQVTIAASTGNITVGSGLIGLFQSKDNGENFTKIVGKANAYFAPFTHLQLGSSQGYYDLCLAVHPADKERVFIGGIGWAEWTKTGGPVIVGNNFDSPFNPFGIHADKHTIVFDTVSDPMIMYIGTDGGVSKTTNAKMTNYANINNGYQTTQFYGIAAGIDGTVVGGTQDNNTLYINGKGNTPQAAVEILGGDGFKCEISKFDSKVIFAQSQYGNLARSLNAGSNMGVIWDERIKNYFVDGTEPGLTPSGIFNSPIRLWEDLTTRENRLYYALNNEVWAANEASTSPNPEWFRVANIGTDPHVMEITPDGSSLFVSGFNGSTIYRVDGLKTVDWDTAKNPGNMIPSGIQTLNVRGNLPSRSITDIEVDESNPNRVIVTMGNYGNTSYVYVSENALSASPSWRSIQGNLPGIPVYDAEISVENPDVIILGTEYGIYACQNGRATTPTWVDNNTNFPLVPVFEMRQVEAKKVDGANGWRTGPVLYAGTHGRGIFRSNNLLTSAREVENEMLVLSTYPNPAVNEVNVEIPASTDRTVQVVVTNYSGQVVYRADMALTPNKSNNLKINTGSLSSGNYIINLQGLTLKASSKFVKIN